MSEFVQSLLDRLSGAEPAAVAVRPQLPSRFEPFSLSPDPWSDGAAEPEQESAEVPPPRLGSPEEWGARPHQVLPSSLAWTPPAIPNVPSPAALGSVLETPASVPPRRDAPDLESRTSTPRRQHDDTSVLDERFHQLDIAMARLQRDRTTPSIVPFTPDSRPDLPQGEALRTPSPAVPAIDVAAVETSPFRSTEESGDKTQSRSPAPRLVPAIEPLANDRARSAEPGDLDERLRRFDREIIRLRGNAARLSPQSDPAVPPDSGFVRDGAEVAPPRPSASTPGRTSPESAAISSPPAWPEIPRLEALESEPAASTVTISIGRIEIRAPQPAAPAAAIRAPARPSRVVSLDDYLRQRGGRS